MPYRPPLVAHEYFVADPPELPVRPPGEEGLSALARAERDRHRRAGRDAQGRHRRRGDARRPGQRGRRGRDPGTAGRGRRRPQPVGPGDHAGHPGRVPGRAGATCRRRAGPARRRLAASRRSRLDPWHLRFIDAAGRDLLEQNRGEADISGRLRTLPFGRSTVGRRGGGLPRELRRRRRTRRSSGSGEKFTPLDKRGQRPVMWNFDAFGAESERAYKNVPFYLSSRGYGVLVDSGMPIEFDICQSTHSCVQIIVPDDLIDYYVIAGPDPARGARPVRPADRPAAAAAEVGVRHLDLLGLLRGHPGAGAGAGADDPRATASRATCCTWTATGRWSGTGPTCGGTPANFPDPDGMLATLDRHGVQGLPLDQPVHLPPQPGVRRSRRRRATSCADRTARSTWPTSGMAPTRPAASSTSPTRDAVEWFTGPAAVAAGAGRRVFKTDFAEGVPADAVAFNGMTGIQLHNVYTLLFNDAVSEVTREVAGHGMVWARSSYLGGQRHAAQWSGDIELPATRRWAARCAAACRTGWPASRSGATTRAASPVRPTPDLYVRWAQFGALSPLVRFHGTTSRLPWEFPEFADAVAVEAIRLRYRLMPYIYSAAVDAARTGAPMMRALLRRLPGRPGRLAGRPGVPARPRPAGRADDRPGRHPAGLPARGRVGRLLDRRGPHWLPVPDGSASRWTRYRCSSGTAR